MTDRQEGGNIAIFLHFTRNPVNVDGQAVSVIQAAEPGPEMGAFPDADWNGAGRGQAPELAVHAKQEMLICGGGKTAEEEDA